MPNYREDGGTCFDWVEVEYAGDEPAPEIIDGKEHATSATGD